MGMTSVPGLYVIMITLRWGTTLALILLPGDKRFLSLLHSLRWQQMWPWHIEQWQGVHGPVLASANAPPAVVPLVPTTMSPSRWMWLRLTRSQCGSLHLKCPPRAHVVKTWSPACNIGKWWFFWGGLQVIGSMALNGTVDLDSLFPSFSFPGHEESVFAPPQAHTTIRYFTTGPNIMGPTNYGLKPSKL
jgi:hypothetical protein